MAIKVGGTTVVDDSRNITGISISGLTTPLSVAQGGTGTASTAHTSLTTNVSGTLPVANGGTGVTTSTGTTNVVLSNSPTLVTPALGTPSSGNLSNCTFPTLNQNTSGSAASLSATLAVASGGTGVTTSTGTTNVVLSNSPTLVTPVLGTPSSGTLSSCTVDGTDAVGFRNIPQNSQSTAYTLVLADAGKHIFHPSSDATARTFTIPANSSVAYAIGTAITFINMTSQVVTIAITTDTMYLSSAGTTGSRSLAQYGSATAIKITSTNWLISGSGLT